MPDDVPFFDPVEDGEECTPREIFARHGYAPLPPADLSELELPGRLWELLYAAAARRFFFHSTNHLSDRQLYTLLWEEWLNHPTVEIPLEAETNTNWIISEFNANGMTGDEIWLRYYADDDIRRALTLESDEILPPHEDLPYDRDRHLPTAPIPLEAHSGWLPSDDEPAEESESGEPDPLGLAEVDREIAAAKGSSFPDEPPPLTSPDSAFESQLDANEPENWRPPAEDFARKKIPLFPPAELTEETLTPILWELLHDLSLQGFYVQHSNHFTDRDLYAELWERGLRDPAYLPGRNPRGGWFHDFLGSWDEEQTQLWLRYYATDEERARHAREYPKDIIPPKEKPVCNRDWRLPKGPF